MRSALYIGSKQNNPLTKTQIPSCASPNGMPFCFEYSGEVTQWQLVKDGEEYGYDLDVSWLTNDGKYIYYNGDVDLLEYLTGLGYNARAGRYSYRFRLDGAYVTVDSLVSLSTPSLASVLYSDAYGIWDLHIDYISGGSFYYDFLYDYTDGLRRYRFNVTPLEIRLYSTGGISLLFTIPNNIILSSGKYNITIKRNSIVDEFFSGGVGDIAVYLEGELIDISGGSGSNPATPSYNYTSCVSNKFEASEGIGIRETNTVLLEEWVTDGGSFEIQQKPTDKTTGGTIKQSNLFQLECEDTRPITPGDFNNDFSNDFF